LPGGYVVRDVSGQALAYLYSRDDPDEARQAKVLTKDEARRIALTSHGCRICWGRVSWSSAVRPPTRW
jgi:K+/H+ antiporter YhaU regulatory subunit KhtT